MAEQEQKQAKRPWRRLTHAEWVEAEVLWRSGQVTLTTLAEKYNCHPDTLKKQFAKKQIKKGTDARAAQALLEEELAKKTLEEAQIALERAKETKEQHYKMSTGLAQLAWAEILNARNENRPFAAVTKNIEAIQRAMEVIKKAREERFAVLGLDKDNGEDELTLPDLVVSELTDDQVVELQARNSAEDGMEDIDDLDVVVVGENIELDEEGDDDELD